MSRAKAKSLLESVRLELLARAGELAKAEWPEARGELAEQARLIEQAKQELAKPCTCKAARLNVTKHGTPS